MPRSLTFLSSLLTCVGPPPLFLHQQVAWYRMLLMHKENETVMPNAKQVRSWFMCDTSVLKNVAFTNSPV